MVAVTVRLVDFMDARPVPGATVDMSLLVSPRFRDEPDPNDPEPEGPPPLLIDGRFTETLRGAGTTGDDGRVTVRFDDAEVFDRLADMRRPEDGKPAVDAVADVHAGAEFLGLGFPSRQLVRGLAKSDRVELVLPVDLGTAIVGHTTPDSVRLWFHLPFEPTPGHEFSCNLVSGPVVAGVPLVPGPLLDGVQELGRTQPVKVEPVANTAVVDFDGLAPDTTHGYSLRVRHRPTGRRFRLVTGSFSTPSAQQSRVAFAFGSCHLPVVTGTPDQPSEEALRSLVHWRRLANRRDHEFLLLTGDQIYGDGIEDKWPLNDDFTRYLRRYRQLWAHRPTRQVLRSSPTYMILDDHDVADDFGTGNIDDGKVIAAIDAYRLFQHAHGPSQLKGPPFHYSFRWGPAAFFVMDGRNRRGDGTPVFGHEQLRDLRRWAASPETRAADVIFFVAPVPLALLPTEVIRKVGEELTEEIGTTVGTLIGLGVGAALGGPFGGASGAGVGAAVLGAVGYEAGDEVFEHFVERGLLYDFDLAERWDLRENQPDLERLLDVLFGLANGLDEDPPRKRTVFILAGDIHAATMHSIRSLPKGTGRRHAANPVIHQLTSSAISHEPVNSTLWVEAVSRIDEEIDLDLKDLNLLTIWDHRHDWEGISAGAIDVDDVFGKGKAQYFLDPNLDRRYLTQFAGLLMQRTVGLVKVERREARRRVYRFDLTIEGESGAQLRSRFDLDLDADLITPVRDNADFVRQSVPDQIQPGQRVPVRVTMRNTGVSDWTPPAYGLEVLQRVWGVDRVPVPEVVRPGREVTFRFEIRAPSAGRFTLQCRMSRAPKLGSRFGRFTEQALVTATSPDTDCAELRQERDFLRDARAAKLNEIHQHPEPPDRLLEELQAIDDNIRAVEGLLDQLGG